MPEATFGLTLILAAGLLNSVYAVPVRRLVRWEFENIWLVYSVVGMGLVGWMVAWWSIPNLLDAYRSAGCRAVGMTVAFGAIWGLANLLFGLGIRWVGIGLAFPISIGLSLVLGTMIPLLSKGDLIFTPGGLTISTGVLLVLAGIIFCGRAGALREKTERMERDREDAPTSTFKAVFWIGLAVVLMSGLMDPFLNFAFAFGDPIRAASIDPGGAAVGAESDGIWALALSGALTVNAAYCVVLLIRRRSWTNYFSYGPLRYWIGAASMGVAWTLSITLYGRGATAMGRLGDSAGWALFYCWIILFSALWAFLTGEWKHAGAAARKTQWTGLALILTAILLLGYANTFGS